MNHYGKLRFLAILLVAGLAFAGCSNYAGHYSDGTTNGKYIEVNGDTISIGTDVNGSLVSNDGTIKSKTESSDGKTVTLTGEVDYSGGSGTAFGVTVTPGNESHWTKPFTATINKADKTMVFQGTLIVDSMDMRTWNVTLKRQ